MSRAMMSVLTAYTDRIAALEMEIARLRAVASAAPHTAFLEAVQRACDERLTQQKHQIRALEARADEAERQLAEARAEIAR